MTDSHTFTDEFGIGYCVFPSCDRWAQIDAIFKAGDLPDGSVLLRSEFAFESEEEAEAWYRDVAPQVDALKEMGRIAQEYPDFQEEYVKACRQVYKARDIIV